MSAKYYIRSRKEENPKKWQGPFDADQLRQMAERRLFSKELHEVSEDRLNWMPSKQIWLSVFPKNVKSVVKPPLPGLSTASPQFVEVDETLILQPSVESSKGQSGAGNSESADWFYAQNDKQYGPVVYSEIQRLATQGRIQITDLVWCPQLGPEWVEAQTIPDLFVTTTAFEFAQDHDDETRKQPKSNGETPSMAWASLILGILGVTILPCLGSILAVIFGHMALAELRRRKGPSGGYTVAYVGLILGWVMNGLFLITVVALGIIIGLAPGPR